MSDTSILCILLSVVLLVLTMIIVYISIQLYQLTDDNEKAKMKLIKKIGAEDTTKGGTMSRGVTTGKKDKFCSMCSWTRGKMPILEEPEKTRCTICFGTSGTSR